MIPVGTGNDWGRMYGIPAVYEEAVRILAEGETFLQDAGKVVFNAVRGTWYAEGGQQPVPKSEASWGSAVGSRRSAVSDQQPAVGNEQITSDNRQLTIDNSHDLDKAERYFVNMAGMGYDALVAHKTNKMKEKGSGGPLSYLYNLLAGLFEYKQKNLQIIVDGNEVYDGKVFSMSIGICRYNGGGMKQLPLAVPDDGLLDITLITDTSKMTVVKNVKKLYDGSHIYLPMVRTYTGRTASLISRPGHGVFLETDGESLGESPMHFEIIPASVRLIVAKGWKETEGKMQ
jgi:diacylglycerol kinase family enzyme